MVAKMQDVAGERGGYLHGRGALDSDDLLYLKEQMEAEADAERLRRRTEKRAFAAFKKAASLADASHLSKVPALRVEPKPRSGIRQQDFLKNIVEVKAKRHRLDAPAQNSNVRSSSGVGVLEVKESSKSQVDHPIESKNSGALLGLTYETSDDESSS
ncbi:hypothetical protein O6H91_Y151900 [Diphasiastrum complanatum]|nr:hypothetical protein O6H91_Y151900 [Diphasiastrum complanatum]